MQITKRTLLVFLTIVLFSVTIRGQVIPIKSIPVVEGSQFLLFPSENLGMGGVSIALEDCWFEGFDNPALGIKRKGSHIYLSPTAYSITNKWGSGSTVPLSVQWKSEKVFGSFSLSIQQLKSNRMDDALSKQNRKNQYLFLSLGTPLANTRSSIGASISWADLDAIHSVDLLYANASEIKQSGEILSIRGGLYSTWPGERTLDMTVIFQKVRMSHHVTFRTWSRGFDFPRPIDSTEINKDWSNTYGLNCRYRQPYGSNGWRMGTTFTVNRKTHPKIPNYSIMNIPRDPGDSWAFNFGAGLSKSTEKSRFGLDVIYEPIWSHTWANAIGKIWTDDNRAILAGEKTVDNKFAFSNNIIRFGISNNNKKAGFQIGLQMRNISYKLKQHDRIQDRRRKQTENWTEWTITGGFDFKFQDFNLHYSVLLTTGTGLPGIAVSPWEVRSADLAAIGAAESNFLIAPSGDLTLGDCHVWTHQITLQIPVGNH